MLGNFSKNSVEKCTELLEADGIFSFTRCERPDGTFYGTGGTCRLGTQVGAREDVDKKILAHFKENSYALPDTSFTGEDVAKMLNDAAKLEGEAGKNFQKIQDFILKDGQAFIVSQALETVAERVGALGVRDLNAKDVPWAVTDNYIKFLQKAGIPKEIFDRVQFAKDRIEQNKRLEPGVKLKAEEEKKSNAEWGYKLNMQQNMLKNIRKQLREDKEFLKDLPRRFSGFAFNTVGVDGSTESFSRIIKVSDDRKANLHEPFDKGRRADPKTNQENWGRILEARKTLGELSGMEKSRMELDTYSGNMGLSRANNRNESVLGTYTHEMGHQMYFRAGEPPRPSTTRYPSEYAKTNTDELFAESFAAYSFNPKALKSFDEGLYNWVDSTVNTALERAGSPL